MLPSLYDLTDDESTSEDEPESTNFKKDVIIPFFFHNQSVSLSQVFIHLQCLCYNCHGHDYSGQSLDITIMMMITINMLAR